MAVELVARTRWAWWFGAVLVVPAAMAATALLWVEPPSVPIALPTPEARALPAAPSVPAVTLSPQPVAVPSVDQVRAEVAAAVAAQPVRFGPDAADLVGPPADTVRRVAELVLASPDITVVLEGHVADTPGGAEAGQQLSDRRAAVVAEALTAAGVPAGRITARGVGAAAPLASIEDSRRVEIAVG